MSTTPTFGLLLDLSHSGFAAVLDGEGEGTLARATRPSGTRHEDAAGWVETLLREAGGDYARLGWICTGVGPGSFTGIRIAMAFAQGFALPRSVPLHGFTSFESLLLSFPGYSSGKPVVVVIPANAGRFYVARGIGDPGSLIDGAALAAMADPEATLLASEETPALRDLSARFAGLWTPGEDWDAVAVARHARASGRSVEKPVYLQLSAAEEKAARDADAS
jgi:tRNA threonylcarbamoyladenosine biosynthesis protein TsaB